MKRIAVFGFAVAAQTFGGEINDEELYNQWLDAQGFVINGNGNETLTIFKDNTSVSDENVAIPGKAFAGGIASGFFGEHSGFNTCLVSGMSLGSDLGKLVSHIKQRDLNKTLSDIEHIFNDVKSALKDCKGAVSNLAPIIDAYKHVRSVQDLLHKMKANVLQWDEVMLGELEQAAQFCTFQAPSANKCGAVIGKGLRQLVIGDNPQLELEAPKKAEFMKGLVKGLLGDSTDIKDCTDDGTVVLTAAFSMIKDIKQRKLEEFVKDAATLMQTLKPFLLSCKDAKDDFKPFLDIMKDVKTKADLYNKIKRNALDNDEQVLDEVGNMLYSCTYKRPDGGKCGHSLGRVMRLFMIHDAMVV